MTGGRPSTKPASGQPTDRQQATRQPTTGRSLSLRQVVANDYWAFVGVAYPALTWVGYLVLLLLGAGADWLGRARPAPADSAPVFLGVAMFFSGIGLPMLVWRWYQLSRIHKNGQEVAGKISRVDFARELIRVDFTYSFQGKPRQARASVHRTAQTRQAQPRDRVMLVVDRERPHKAFVRDWMCKTVSGAAKPEEVEE